MNYTALNKRVKGIINDADLVEQTHFFGSVLALSSEGKVYINNHLTEFESLDEARSFVKHKDIGNEISKEIYEEILENKIANIIREEHKVKVTDTLVESYKELASSNMFSVDPVVHRIRSLNKLDRLIENKLHYVLKDESIVAISESTQERLNNLLQNQSEIIEYMRENKEHFMHVLTKLEE
jgi:hypothetical protein